MKTKYNVYQETDMAAIEGAAINMGIENLLEPHRKYPMTAQTMVQRLIEGLCDAVSEDEAERALAEEVLAAKERIAEANELEKCLQDDHVPTTPPVKRTAEAFMPYPDMPLHIENLDTIPKLEAQGWQGMDASLEISLFEYGFAWRELAEPDADGDDIYFIYSPSRVSEGRNEFARCGMKKSTEVMKEWSWIDLPSLCEYYGLPSAEAFLELPFYHKVEQLYQYYGAENIFGGDYGNTFSIADPQDEADNDFDAHP